MSSPQGELGGGESAQDIAALARAQGYPSDDQMYRRRVLMLANGQWIAGRDTSGFQDSIGYFLRDGKKGTAGGGKAISITGATLSVLSAGERTVTKTGAFVGWTFYEGATIVATGGTGVTPVEVKITAATDDTLTLDDPGLGELPAGPIADFAGSLSSEPVLEPLVPLLQPGSADIPQIVGGANQSSFWDTMFAVLAPGELTMGAHWHTEIVGRLVASNLASRPSRNESGSADRYPAAGKVTLAFVIDPWSASPMTQRRLENEQQYDGTVPLRRGWTPGGDQYNTTATIAPQDGTAAPADGSVLVVNLPSHGYQNGELVHITPVGISNPIFAAVDPGQAYYVKRGTYNGTAPINNFRLYPYWDHLADPQDGLGTPLQLDISVDGDPADPTPVGGPDYLGAVPVMVSKFNNSQSTGYDAYIGPQGSMHRVQFMFELTYADLGADLERVGMRLEIDAYADGRTSGTEEGVIWLAKLELFDNQEEVGNYQNRPVQRQAAPKVWRSTIWRTTPGTALNTSTVLQPATAAPLWLAKRAYITASGQVSFTNAGQDGVSLLTDPSFANLQVGDTIVVTTGATLPGEGPIAGTYTVQSSADTVISLLASGVPYSWTGGPVVSGYSIPSDNAYWSTMWDYGGQYDIVHVDAPFITVSNNPANGLTDLPLASRRSNYATATVTYVSVTASEADLIGEVVYHDDSRGVLFIAPFVDEDGHARHVQNGETLTLYTYTREWATQTSPTNKFNTTASQTKTVTAKTVEIGPHATVCALRMGVSGPQDSNVQLEARVITSEILTHGSR